MTVFYRGRAWLARVQDAYYYYENRRCGVRLQRVREGAKCGCTRCVEGVKDAYTAAFVFPVVLLNSFAFSSAE